MSASTDDLALSNGQESSSGANLPKETASGQTSEGREEGGRGAVTLPDTGFSALSSSSNIAVTKGSVSVPPTLVVSPTANSGGEVKPASLAAKVNAALGANLKIPAGLKGIDTSNPVAQDYFHGMIYGETGARKTTTAAKMFGRENTLIVLCRQPEQVIPLRGLGYRVLHAQDAESLVFALMYPEKAATSLLNWPEWGSLPNRALVFDDITEGVALMLDRHSTNDRGEERKDARQIYRYAGAELNDLFKLLRRKNLHLILIALAKITTNEISNEEFVAPDLPPSMRSFINTDLEFVFFVDKSKWKFVTTSVYRSYEGTDEKTGKAKLFRREIFGKNKIPLRFQFKQPGVFPPTNEVSMAKGLEDEDLGRVWKSVRSGTPIEGVGGGVKR